MEKGEASLLLSDFKERRARVAMTQEKNVQQGWQDVAVARYQKMALVRDGLSKKTRKLGLYEEDWDEATQLAKLGYEEVVDKNGQGNSGLGENLGIKRKVFLKPGLDLAVQRDIDIGLNTNLGSITHYERKARPNSRELESSWYWREARSGLENTSRDMKKGEGKDLQTGQSLHTVDGLEDDCYKGGFEPSGKRLRARLDAPEPSKIWTDTYEGGFEPSKTRLRARPDASEPFRISNGQTQLCNSNNKTEKLELAPRQDMVISSKDVISVPVKDHAWELAKREMARQQFKTIKLGDALHRTRVPMAFKNSLIWQAYKDGLDRLAAENISVAGWTKSLSSILCAGTKGGISKDFDDLAGWDDHCSVDAYNLGITCVVKGSLENKVSTVRGFLLYMQTFNKKSPWLLEDIFSFCLRLIAAGYVGNAAAFSSIVRDLLPLRLIRDNFGSFSEQIRGLRWQLSNAFKRDSIHKCPPWQGSASVKDATSSVRWMLALWLCAGTRFSSIQYVRAGDIMSAKVKGYPVVIVTLWQDKIIQHQGRQVVLSCNCQLGLQENEQLCPVCKHPGVMAASACLSPSGWDAVRVSFNIPLHAVRRRMALEILKFNMNSSGKRTIAAYKINIFLGWVKQSKMFKDYTSDWRKTVNAIFLHSIPALERNIELTAFVESEEFSMGPSSRDIRGNVKDKVVKLLRGVQDAEEFWDLLGDGVA